MDIQDKKKYTTILLRFIAGFSIFNPEKKFVFFGKVVFF